MGRVRRHFHRRAGRDQELQQALPGRQQRNRRVVCLHLGRDLLPAPARVDVLRHPRRPHHVGRPQRLGRRPPLHGDPGRRLGDIPVRRGAGHLASGPRYFPGAHDRAVRAANHLCGRLCRIGPAPAADRSGPRAADRSGIRGFGTRRHGTPPTSGHVPPAIRCGFRSAPAASRMRRWCRRRSSKPSKPTVELIAIGTTQERGGVNV